MPQKWDVNELLKRVLDFVSPQTPEDLKISLGEMSQSEAHDFHQYWARLEIDREKPNRFTILLHPDFNRVKWLVNIADETGAIIEQEEIRFDEEGNPESRFQEEYRMILFGHLYEQTITLLREVLDAVGAETTDEEIDYKARRIAENYFESLL